MASKQRHGTLMLSTLVSGAFLPIGAASAADGTPAAQPGATTSSAVQLALLAALPEGLAYKMAHFSHTGRIVLSTDEIFKEASWFAVMMGQGLQPADYNPLLDSLSPEENQAHLARIEQQIATALGSMPRHEDYIRRQLRTP